MATMEECAEAMVTEIRRDMQTAAILQAVLIVGLTCAVFSVLLPVPDRRSLAQIIEQSRAATRQDIRAMLAASSGAKAE